MKQYEVPVTRMIQSTIMVAVAAENPEEAVDNALKLVCECPEAFEWEPDDPQPEVQVHMNLLCPDEDDVEEA